MAPVSQERHERGHRPCRTPENAPLSGRDRPTARGLFAQSRRPQGAAEDGRGREGTVLESIDACRSWLVVARATKAGSLQKVHGDLGCRRVSLLTTPVGSQAITPCGPSRRRRRSLGARTCARKVIRGARRVQRAANAEPGFRSSLRRVSRHCFRGAQTPQTRSQHPRQALHARPSTATHRHRASRNMEMVPWRRPGPISDMELADMPPGKPTVFAEAWLGLARLGARDRQQLLDSRIGNDPLGSGWHLV